MEDLLEKPLLSEDSSPRPCCSTCSFLNKVAHNIQTILVVLFGMVVLSALIIVMGLGQATIHKISQSPQKPGADYVFVSSFNVSSTSIDPSVTNWDAKLALNYPGITLEDFHVSYDAQAWLYFRQGFVSTARLSSPSIYVADREDGRAPALHVHANFTVNEDLRGERAVILDLSMEANSTEKPNARESYLEITSFLLIDCNDLTIELPANQSPGTLSGGGKSCRVERCVAKSDAVNGNSDRCTRVYD